MDRYAADRMFKRLARRAGITKRISPHSLSHCFHHRRPRCRRAAAGRAGDGQPYDRGRGSLGRQASYVVATFLAGASR